MRCCPCARWRVLPHVDPSKPPTPEPAGSLRHHLCPRLHRASNSRLNDAPRIRFLVPFSPVHLLDYHRPDIQIHGPVDPELPPRHRRLRDLGLVAGSIAFSPSGHRRHHLNFGRKRNWKSWSAWLFPRAALGIDGRGDARLHFPLANSKTPNASGGESRTCSIVAGSKPALRFGRNPFSRLAPNRRHPFGRCLGNHFHTPPDIEAGPWHLAVTFGLRPSKFAIRIQTSSTS